MPEPLHEPRARRYRICVPILVVMAVLLISIQGQSQAIRGSDLPKCKDITAKISQADGLIFDGFSPTGDSVFFKHPSAKSVTLQCGYYLSLNISLTWDQSGYPPNRFFTTAALLGSILTGSDERSLLEYLHLCHVNALKSSDELAELSTHKAEITCQAFIRDGGGVVMIIAAP